MITPMKKVTVLCLDALKDESLEMLRSMGIMHVVPLQTPKGNDYLAAKTAVQRVKKALDSLPEKVSKEAKPLSEDGETLVTQIHSLILKRKSAEDSIQQMILEIKKFSAFQNLSPVQIQNLETKGVCIRLYEAHKGHSPNPDGVAIVKDFGKGANGHSFAVINYGKTPVAVTDAADMGLPSASLVDLRKKLEKTKKELIRCENALSTIAAERAKVQETLACTTDEFNLKEASSGMIEGAGVSLIQGYCPTPRLEELQKTAPKFGWGLKVEDPSADDDVPTLLKEEKTVSSIQFLYNIIGITPGYREVDTSAVFLLFFSVFFAMIVGDTAYGILFLGLTLFARKKFPKAKPQGFWFMEIMSIATIIWGLINDSFLGFNPAFMDLAQMSWTPEFLKNALLWIRISANLQLFCFCIAITHLSIAHLWNFTVKLRQKSTTAIAQIGWLCTTWVMFFLAGFMVLNRPLPSFTIPLFVVGVVLLLLFRVPPSRLKEDWISIPMLVLDLVSNFVDVVSYIRLFAVGMSGAAIAAAFNGMLSPLFGSFWGILAAAFILFFVHALNIALGVMGVAVHAVRLNTLEFSNHMELQWSGYNFAPLSKHKSN